MGLIDDASLAFTAALGASKPGTAYSLKPTDGSGDFAFTRADDPNDGGLDLAATFINQQGYIEKGYENFLSQSNNFDTSPWSVANGGAITPNHSGYDGSNDAWYLYKNTGTTSQLVRQSITSSGVKTFSFYAKAAELEWIRFLWTGGTGGRNHFHLVGDGDFGTPQNIISRNIEAVGDGWYKCSTTFNDSISQIQIYPASGTNSVSGSTGGVYIQDAMLNEGLVAMPYIESGASKAQKGLVQDEPRFTFSNGKRSLLLEPERTNRVIQSEYFDFAGYEKTRTVIETNSTISPEGLKNASKIKESVSELGLFAIKEAFGGIAINQDVVLSCFLKKGSLRYGGLRLVINSGQNQFFVNVDLETGDIASTDTYGGVTFSPNVEPYDNDWYRVSVKARNTSGYIDTNVALSNVAEPTYSSNFPYYTSTGNGYIYAYGYQFEIDASYPSSYIPTYGTTKTRFEDYLTSTLLPVDGLFGPTAGTIFLEFANPLENMTNNWFYITSLLAGGRYMRVRNYWQFNFTNLTFDPYSNLSRTDGATKIAVKWGDGVVKVFTDHRSPESATYTGGDINLNGHLSNLNGDFGFYKNNANFKKIMFFRTALSDDECIELTTL